MGENNRKGTSAFYAIMGVATLVVAIIGATFAYFGVTTDTNTNIQGEAATAGLTLEVTKLSTNATAGLIPLTDDDLGKALTGVGDVVEGQPYKNTCLDSNGNTVCQLYEVTVSNVGSATAIVNGTIELAANTSEDEEDETSVFTNLKWQVLTVGENNALSVNEVYNEMDNTLLVEELSLAPASDEATTDTQTLYVMVWISNLTEEDQSDADTGHFMGSIKFNSADGSGVSASFSA